MEIERGVGRHVVRFVEYGASFFVLKELPDDLVAREHRLLRALRDSGVPAVEPLGTVVGRASGQGVLLTRHLDFSLPYRLVFRRRLLPDFWERLLDALAELLVRAHLAGFFWGDCSLSNTLFRRDAGALCAYIVDTETGELHERLSDGQRRYDLDIAELNLAGELLDLEHEVGRTEGRDPVAVAADVRRRYERLWAELTDDEVFGDDERHRLERRLRRAQLEQSGESVVSETAAAGRWLAEVFEPAIAAIPRELRGKREAAELYHELLEHRWFLSEAAGDDVGFEAALRSYVDGVLTGAPDERAALGRATNLVVEADER